MKEKAFDEVVEDLLLYLHTRDYKDEEKNRVKLRLMFFIFKTCYNEETLKKSSQILERKLIIK